VEEGILSRKLAFNSGHGDAQEECAMKTEMVVVVACGLLLCFLTLTNISYFKLFMVALRNRADHYIHGHPI